MQHFFIIDAIGFLFRSFYAIRGMSSSKGIPTNALYGFIRSIEKLFKDFDPKYCVAVFDGPNNKASRVKLYEHYKSNRTGMPDDLAVQLDPAIEFCKLIGIPVLQIEGVEADDTIGTLTRFGLEKGFFIDIVSQDKDLCQLVSAHVNLIHAHKDNLIINSEKVQELYGVKPEQIVDYLAIIGDTSDNIPGITGLGPKAAASLLKEFHTLKNLYANLDAIASDKKRQQLFDAKEVAFLSQSLAMLDFNVTIPQDLSFYEREQYDQEKLAEFYNRYDFHTLLKSLTSETPVTNSKKITTHTYTIIESEAALFKMLSALEKCPSICVDVESESLDKIDGKIVGIGIGGSPETLFYIPFNGTLDEKIIHRHLKPFFSSKSRAFFGHNIKFDLHLLTTHDLFPTLLGFDTMVASYVLHPENNRHNLDFLSLEILQLNKIPIESLIGSGKNQKSMKEAPIEEVARYCTEDVYATILLKEYFEKEIQKAGLETVFYSIDLPLIPVLYSMERHGIYVDKHGLHELSKVLSVEIKKLEEKIFQLAGFEFNIKSPKQLSEVLFTTLQIKPKKKNATTGFSTSADVLESLENEHPIISSILQYRTFEKLRSTYVDSLPDQIHPKTRRIHCNFNQSVTATGRLSCQDPNLQNIPVRSEIGNQIRAAFRPEDPHSVFLAADYSQIELRIVAHFSEDATLVKAFKHDEDVHRLTASLIFDVPIEAVTSEMRSQAKAVNFGIIYGQQAFGLSKETGLSIKEASLFIQRYFERYPKIKAFLESLKEDARKNGFTKSLMGRKRYLSDIHSKNPMLRAQAERFAVNAPIQGTQADIIKLAMVEIDKLLKERHLKSFMVLQIHDELVFEVPKDELLEVESIVKKTMESVYPLKVPLKVNIAVGKNWAEC
jgi:DNA polymerase-1